MKELEETDPVALDQMVELLMEEAAEARRLQEQMKREQLRSRLGG